MTIDDDLAAWIAGLDDLFALVAGRFFRVEPRLRARAYVRGLLAPLATKKGWTLAEAAGDATPDGMQRLLNRAAWDDDGVRDDVRALSILSKLRSTDTTRLIGCFKPRENSAQCGLQGHPRSWDMVRWRPRGVAYSLSVRRRSVSVDSARGLKPGFTGPRTLRFGWSG
jgi:hypothetical protein